MNTHEFNKNDRQWHFYVGPIGKHVRMVIWAETKKEALRRISAMADGISFHMIDADTVKSTPIGMAVVLAPHFPDHKPKSRVFTQEEQIVLNDWAQTIIDLDDHERVDVLAQLA